MADEKRKEVETCIYSVLTSNPLRMTVKDLDKEFANMIGYKIPYSELGHKTLEAYLRSIPHRVVVNGIGYHAEVLVVVSEKSAHIDNLIRRQKVATTKKSLRCGLRKNVTIRQQFQQMGKNPTRDFPKNAPTKKTNWERNMIHGPHPQNQSTPLKNDLLPSTPIASPSPKVEQLSKTVSHTSANYHDKVSMRSVKRSPVPNYIKNRLKQIIVKHPEGLHCNQLPDLYKNQFGHNLNFFDYGYKSVAQLCMDLTGIFSYQRLKDSTVKVFDKDLNIEIEHEPLEPVEMPRCTLNKNTEPALPLDVENILLDFHNKHLTKDVVTNASIVRQWLGADVGIEDYIDLVVGEVYDPTKFWIQLLQHTDALNQLMDRMQLFYRDKKGVYDIPPYAIKDDMYLVCMFEGEYHRAKVIESLKKKEGKLKVFYIDYGTVAIVQSHGLCYLVEDFVALPAQAIRARLYGVQPPERDSPWSRAASARFLSWVYNKALVGQVYDIDEEDMILDLIIADTSNPNRDVFLNDCLVHEELAVFSDEEAHEPKPRDFEPTVPDVHLYPTHKELETGLAPTYQAMFFIDASNLSYDKILPKYFRSINGEKSELDEQSRGSKEMLLFSGAESDGERVPDSVEIVSESTSSAASETEPCLSPIGSERERLRPPPGIYVPEMMNHDNQNCTAAVTNASMYLANMIASQTILNAMAMANPYYHNCFPYHEPNPYSLPYNINPYNTPLPAYKPHDLAFYPTQPPCYHQSQLHWPPSPNVVDEYHQIYPYLAQPPPSLEYKTKHLNYLSPGNHSQNNSVTNVSVSECLLRNQEYYSVLHRLNIDENVVINQPDRAAGCNTFSSKNAKSLGQINTASEVVNTKNVVNITTKLRSSVTDNTEIPKNIEDLLHLEKATLSNKKEIENIATAGNTEYCSPTDENVVQNSLRLPKNDEFNLAITDLEDQNKSTINNRIQADISLLKNVENLLLPDKTTLDNKIGMDDIRNDIKVTKNSVKNAKIQSSIENPIVSTTQVQKATNTVQDKCLTNSTELKPETYVLPNSIQEEDEINIVSGLFENLSIGNDNNLEYVHPTSPIVSVDNMKTASDTDLESSLAKMESQEETLLINLSSTTVDSPDSKVPVSTIKIFRTSIELKIEDGPSVDADVESHLNLIGDMPENTSQKNRVHLECIGGTDVHVITMRDNEKYFTLREISLRLFESLRPELACRLIAASPYLIDIDDIYLGHDPELKAELVAGHLIRDEDCKIEVISIGQFPELVKAVYGETPTRQCDDFVEDLNNFVKLTK